MDLRKIVSGLTLEQKIGQLIVAGFETGKADDPHFLELVHKYHVGNVILFTRNLGERRETCELTQGIRETIMADTGIPPLVAVDQEGGMVTRIFHAGNVIPGNMLIGATFDEHNAYLVGRITAQEMRALGMNMNLAPCTEAPIYRRARGVAPRAYSDNPYMIAAFDKEFIRGMQENGVIGTAKHFPGYTGCNEDGHLTLTTNTHDLNTLQKIELNTFRMVLAGGPDGVMAAHMFCPALVPERRLTSASRDVITGILKNQMGYKGIIITDCLDMHSVLDIYGAGRGAVEFIKAGVHLLDISHTLKSQSEACNCLKEAVLSGEIPMEQLDQTVYEILAMKQKYGLFEAEKPIDERLAAVDWEGNRRTLEEIAEKGVTVVRGEEMLPLKKGNGLFISTLPMTLVIVDEKIDAGNTFARAAAQYFDGTAREISLSPTDEEIAALAEEAKTKDYVVIGTYNSCGEPGQVKLQQELVKANPNVISIALRSPFDIDYAQEVPGYILGYEYTRNSIHALLRILNGEIKATGRAPLAIYPRKLD